MVPTKRFWLLVALGIPIGAVVGQAGFPSFWLAYDALLLSVAFVTLMMAPSPRDLTVRRKFDPVLSVRVPNRIEVTLANDGLETIRALVRDEPPPGFLSTRRELRLEIASGRERTFDYTVTPFERGSDYFRGTWLRIDCPMGLAFRQVRLPTEQPVRVYPNVLALREFDLLKHKGRLQQMGIRKSRVRGLGMVFESLREYSEGDDFRKIDWKASARRGKLVVRQFEQERNQAVILVIDIGRKMLSEVNGVTKLDHTLDSCLMLAHAASAAGDLIGLLVFGDTVRRYIPPKKGRHQLGFIIEALHDLVAEPIESDPGAAMAYLSSRWKRRALLVSFTDALDLDEAQELVVGFGPTGRRHILLVARVADPGIEERALVVPDDAESLYRKAAALRIIEERKKALSVIESGGLYSLEAEPQDLAAALVSFYFEVKERSLL